jgi:hypothetical protein
LVCVAEQRQRVQPELQQQQREPVEQQQPGERLCSAVRPSIYRPVFACFVHYDIDELHEGGNQKRSYRLCFEDEKVE